MMKGKQYRGQWKTSKAFERMTEEHATLVKTVGGAILSSWTSEPNIQTMKAVI